MCYILMSRFYIVPEVRSLTFGICLGRVLYFCVRLNYIKELEKCMCLCLHDCSCVVSLVNLGQS